MMPPPDKNTSVFPHGHIDRSTWKRVRLGEVLSLSDGDWIESKDQSESGYRLIQTGNIGAGEFVYHQERARFISTETFARLKCTEVFSGDCLISRLPDPIGRACILPASQNRMITAVDCAIARPINNVIDRRFFVYFTSTVDYKRQMEKALMGSTRQRISRKSLNEVLIPLPGIEIQKTIVSSLSAIDTLCNALKSLIAKYEAIKKATVNLLLEPKAGWKRMKLDEICMCLDNYRKPVNEVERAGMQGDIPYCGANGIVDYVNDFTIDDSIILIAEDGGYFDQYESRPIAYRMSGKAWINNHAHILKAKSDYCQAFIFYSLEHKDITPFITSGTRAKLTKGELSNIEIDTPSSFQEQRKIAEQITAIDNVLADYKAQLEKARQLKAGMMSYFFG